MVIGSMMVSRAEVDRYGIISPEEEDGIIKIRHLVEKPQPDQAPSNLAVIGRYLSSNLRFSRSWSKQSRARAGRFS